MKASIAFLIFTICFHASASLGSSQADGTSSSQANGSSSSQADSCGSKLNLGAPLFFDTTKLNCLPVWNAQGFILRVSALCILTNFNPGLSNSWISIALAISIIPIKTLIKTAIKIARLLSQVWLWIPFQRNS